MNKVVIFDLDGTIIDVRHRYFEVMRVFLEMKSLPKLSFEEYIKFRYNGYNDFLILHKLSRSFNYVEDFKEFKLANIERVEYLEMDRLCPGAIFLLDKLISCGIRLELLTLRRNLDNLKWQMETFSILSCFSNITYDSGELSKSAYLESLIECSNEVVFIGDSDYDYKAAIESRTKFYLVGDGFFSTIQNSTKEKQFSYQEIITELCEDKK
jgi:phosphoglycolate phosphatase-like HAD superfamily hydrolase